MKSQPKSPVERDSEKTRPTGMTNRELRDRAIEIYTVTEVTDDIVDLAQSYATSQVLAVLEEINNNVTNARAQGGDSNAIEQLMSEIRSRLTEGGEK